MPTTNDFKPFATDPEANVLTQAEYIALTGTRANGFNPGVASSRVLNKVWRQSSVITAAVAQHIANVTGQSVLDNGDFDALVTQIGLALGAGGAGLAKRLKADYGAVGDGVADDTAKFVTAIAAVPEGGTLILDGLFRVTDTVVINRRVSLYCFGANHGILVEVGTNKDGVLFDGATSLTNGLNGVDIRLNVYGRANACEHAVAFHRVDRSRIQLNIRAGATAYGLRIRGCLINQWDVESSTNYWPPITGYATQVNHILVENFGVASEASRICTVSGPASPAVVNLTSHGFTAGTSVVFTGSTKPPSPFILGKPYYVLASGLSTNSFQLSATSGGTAIATTVSGGGAYIARCTQFASNTNRFWVNLEGARDGYIQTAMPGEGSNTLLGEMEGLTGTPIYVESSLGFQVYDLKMEANAQDSTFSSCESLNVGRGVVYFGGGSFSNTMNFISCENYNIEGVFARLNISSTCKGGSGGNVQCTTHNEHVILDRSFEQTGPFTNTTTRNVLGGPGNHAGENVFQNPYFDLWANGTASLGPPLGCTAAGFASRVTTPRYPGNPNIHTVRVTNAGATINSGMQANLSFNPVQEDGWINVFTPVYVESGQPGVAIFLFDGNAYHAILYDSTTKDQWIEARGAVKLVAGNSFQVIYTAWNGSNYSATGQFFVGGCTVRFGPIPAKHLQDNGRRRANIFSTVSNPPDITGQVAITGGSIYMSAGNATASEWLKISP